MVQGENFALWGPGLFFSFSANRFCGESLHSLLEEPKLKPEKKRLYHQLRAFAEFKSNGPDVGLVLSEPLKPLGCVIDPQYLGVGGESPAIFQQTLRRRNGHLDTDKIAGADIRAIDLHKHPAWAYIYGIAHINGTSGSAYPMTQDVKPQRKPGMIAFFTFFFHRWGY